MPKKNRERCREQSDLDAWYEHRDIDREYYGYCYCYDIMCNRDGEELPCHSCKRAVEEEVEEDRLSCSTAAHSQAPPKPSHPHQAAITFIGQKMAQVQAANGLAESLPLIRELFESVLKFQAFFAASPRMRTAVENKVAEFRADPRAAELLPLFDQVTEMLRGLGSA